MQIITDIELRAHWYKTRETIVEIDKGAMLTPAARDFVHEHKIQLVEKGSVPEAKNEPKPENEPKPDKEPEPEMPRTRIPLDEQNHPVYMIESTGEKVSEKPENMTHLYGNVLVPKTDERIAFRGQLDSLEAQVIELEQCVLCMGRTDLCEELKELLAYIRKILGAEVCCRPLEEIRILGMDSKEIRRRSHNVKEYFGIPHPVPSGDMGKVPVELNALRTKVREAELAAARAYGAGCSIQRNDIIEAMNRLSSCVYILFCREVAKLRGENRCGNRECAAAECVSEKHASPEAEAAKAAPSAKQICREMIPGDIMVEASGRHVHLTPEAVKVLFGQDDLTPKSPLSQPGQYAAKERVTIMTSKGEFENVAVLGPVRKEVQVELSLTDARVLGIKAPVNLSGNLNNAADVILKGPNGIYNAVQSAIVSKAYIHMTPKDAQDFCVEDGDSVSLRIETDRPVTIDDVIIRVSDKYALAAHLDYDEANACGYKKGHIGHIIK